METISFVIIFHQTAGKKAIGVSCCIYSLKDNVHKRT